MASNYQTGTDKLQLLEDQILMNAKQQCSDIINAANAEHDEQLQKAESRIAREAEEALQRKTAEINPRLSRKLSQVIRHGRVQLYQEREDYLAELMGAARKALVEFAESPKYEPYLLGQIRQVVKNSELLGITIKLCPRDMKYAPRIRELFGNCDIVPDETNVTIGGAILFEKNHQVMIDLTIDSALMQQKQWLYENAGLIFSETGETD